MKNREENLRKIDDELEIKELSDDEIEKIAGAGDSDTDKDKESYMEEMAKRWKFGWVPSSGSSNS